MVQISMMQKQTANQTGGGKTAFIGANEGLYRPASHSGEAGRLD
jgi:hypothetical protein